MTDHEVNGTGDDLPTRIGRLVLDTPGVLRLEPTLRGTLSRFGGIGGDHGADTLGAQVISRSGSVVVTVDLAVSTSRPALETAKEVARRIRSEMQTAGRRCDSVEVNILSIS